MRLAKGLNSSFVLLIKIKQKTRIKIKPISKPKNQIKNFQKIRPEQKSMIKFNQGLKKAYNI